MVDVRVTGGGARLPLFIPCLNNCCAAIGSKMVLINYEEPSSTPHYQCSRKGCEFNLHPKDARELTYWHADPDKKRRRDRDYGPSRDDFDRSVM